MKAWYFGRVAFLAGLCVLCLYVLVITFRLAGLSNDSENAVDSSAFASIPETDTCNTSSSYMNDKIAFEEPLPGLWRPKGVSGFAVFTEPKPNEGLLFYRNGTFYLFTDAEDKVNEQLSKITVGNAEFPFKVHPESQRPTASHRLHGTSWILLCPQDQSGLIDHYFHFMEYLVALWPVDQLHQRQHRATVESVNHVVLGPKLLHHHWQRVGQFEMNAALLQALHPNATIWDGDHPLPYASQGTQWVSFERAVITERFGTTTNEEVQHTNKMDMAVARWAMHHDQTIWEGMKDRVLANFCPGSCRPRASVAFYPVLHKTFDGLEYSACVRKPRLSYISRQQNERRLSDGVAQKLEELLTTKWSTYFDVQIVYMQNLSPEDQLRLAARTDILLGIHGNGLTHGFWMPRGGVVVELLVQGSCLRDFQFFASVGGQHWVGMNRQGVVSPGHPGFCHHPGWGGLDINNVDIDLGQLETVLFTLQNLANRDVFV